MAYALSVRQPWAFMISKQIKTIEIRNWHTSFRGKLLIHASMTLDVDAAELFNLDERVLHVGGLIGEVSLIDVFKFKNKQQFSQLQDKHLTPLDRYEKDLFGFILESAVLFNDFIPYRGKLGIFKVEL